MAEGYGERYLDLCLYRNPCRMGSKLRTCVDIETLGILSGDDYATVLQKIAKTIVSGGAGLQSVQAGTNIVIDDTDPLNPVINAQDTGVEIGIVPNYSSLPSPTDLNGKFYYVVDPQGTRWLPGSIGGTYHPNGIYYSNGTIWITGINPWQATQSDVDAGIISEQFVSPLTLENAAKWDTKENYTITDIGTSIDFTTKKIFNNVSVPATENITDNLTGAKVGVVQKIYHNSGIVPTFPVGWVKRGTGNYVVSTLNIIYAEWCEGTTVEYWIVQ